MRLPILAALVVAALPVSPASVAAQDGVAATAPAIHRAAIVARAVDEVIRPGYRALKASATEAAAVAGRLCEAPDAAALEAARGAFRSLATAFARVEFIRFGPAAADNRLERFLFWPDRRGTALRQIQAAIADEATAPPSAAALRSRSVAVQGLTALEYVLFGTGSEALAGAEGARRCLFARAIAENLAAIAGEITAEWDAADGIAARLAAPNGADPQYRTVDDALAEILGTVLHGLEAVEELRIAPALGTTPEAVRPNLFLFARSGTDRLMLLSDVRGLGTLLEGSGLLGALPPASRWVASSVQLEFETADNALARVGEPLGEVAASEGGHQALATVSLALAGLRTTLTTEVGPALGLRTGFSSLDGD